MGHKNLEYSRKGSQPGQTNQPGQQNQSGHPRKRTIFLDRDGTLIVDKIYLNDPGKIEYLPGVFEALRELRDQGFSFVVVTNQSGVARGIVDIQNLYRIHQIIAEDFARRGVEFLQFYYAPYLVESNHPMRKPNPGMIERALGDYRLCREGSWIIGDRMTDVEAGHRAGIRSILLAGVERPQDSRFSPPTAFVEHLLAAKDFILQSGIPQPLEISRY